MFVVYRYSHRSSDSTDIQRIEARCHGLRPIACQQNGHSACRSYNAVPYLASQSNPSADLALHPLLGPRTTVASAQSCRSGAIVTRGTVPAEWPFCWQELHGGHSTVPGVPRARPSRTLVVLTLLGIRVAVATAASVHPPTALPAQLHMPRCTLSFVRTLVTLKLMRDDRMTPAWSATRQRARTISLAPKTLVTCLGLCLCVLLF